MGTMIRIEGVRKSFRGKEVLRGVDLTIDRGESVVIIGRSGGGKSVLLKLIIGLLKPDAGKIWIDGSEITRLKKHELARVRRRFGMLFQGAALFDSMTVRENIALPRREQKRSSEAELDAVVRERLAMVGLEGIEELKPAALSGGMKKRVGLARALASDPEVMLYDEPTTGLDPVSGDMINDLIVALRERLHVTSIAVTHDMRSAYRIADSIAMIHEGRIIFRGTVEETQGTDDEIVRGFISGEGDGDGAPLPPLPAGDGARAHHPTRT
jgi:phospholipid/cholesterol/gamma-HCH transport system ATP-binding protein